MSGKVYLIGAGPGDFGLLTLRAKEVLETADVVVYDALANANYLSLARKDAECIYVGKIADKHALKQHEINALLVAKAQEGKRVARLKGGDPYIFGRGGEEAQELLQAGIPFEEVPGISSTIAAPVVGAMLEDILPYLGYEPSFTEEELAEQGDVTVQTYIGQKPHEAQSAIRSAGLKTEIVGSGTSVIKQVPEPGKTLPYGGTVILYTDESEANSTATVPDVLGRGVSDANQIITNAGFNINITGTVPEGQEEIVVTQDPQPGTTAEVGSVVTVSLEPPSEETEETAGQTE